MKRNPVDIPWAPLVFIAGAVLAANVLLRLNSYEEPNRIRTRSVEQRMNEVIPFPGLDRIVSGLTSYQESGYACGDGSCEAARSLEDLGRSELDLVSNPLAVEDNLPMDKDRRAQYLEAFETMGLDWTIGGIVRSMLCCDNLNVGDLFRKRGEVYDLAKRYNELHFHNNS